MAVLGLGDDVVDGLGVQVLERVRGVDGERGGGLHDGDGHGLPVPGAFVNVIPMLDRKTLWEEGERGGS